MDPTIYPIYQSLVVRPRNADNTPKNDALQLTLYYRHGYTLLPTVPEGVLVELHFADGLGSEVWRERCRQVLDGHILTLHLTALRRPSIGSALLRTGANPRVIRALTGFTVRVPNCADPADLHFAREDHPDSTRFLPVSSAPLSAPLPDLPPPG